MRATLKHIRAAVAFAAVLALGLMLGIACAVMFGLIHAAASFIENVRDGWRAAADTWRDLV